LLGFIAVKAEMSAYLRRLGSIVIATETDELSTETDELSCCHHGYRRLDFCDGRFPGGNQIVSSQSQLASTTLQNFVPGLLYINVKQ